MKAQPGDPNRATWLNGSAESDATPGMWGMFTVDEARGLVFFPVEKVEGNGANDYWGGGNHGHGLYSDSLVALDATTGRMKWHQQVVHHDIWDYDLAAAPVLVDVRRNGQVIPAVAQSSKMALLFIFNRETGEPVFGMEERAVPQTTVPGRVDVADAAVPGQARAAVAQLVQASRPRRRSRPSTRRSVRTSGTRTS